MGNHIEIATRNGYNQAIDDCRLWLTSKLEKMKKERFLSNNNLQWQLGWCEGHSKAIDELIKSIGGRE